MQRFFHIVNWVGTELKDDFRASYLFILYSLHCKSLTNSMLYYRDYKFDILC